MSDAIIINSKEYSGECACGRVHGMTTEFCIIEAGCMKRFSEYASKYGLCGFSVAIYDENTYAATSGLRPRADKEIILPKDGLHADEHGVALAEAELPRECDYLIAVGAGTVHDITRYIAHSRNIPFISCPTAASVDGFCSSVAAMTWHGFKKIFTATAPKIVIADIDIISRAPRFLTNSGFGDMIGKFIALSDWKISHILTDEYLCQKIYNMTMDATRAVMECAPGIKLDEPAAYQKLVYGLLLSGIAMQLLGNSRCASGAEHHVSHFIEMRPDALKAHSYALHGEKVGVGTLLACKEYHALACSENISFSDSPSLSEEYFLRIFGKSLADSVIKENANNCAGGISADVLRDNLGKICEVIYSIPRHGELLEIYTSLGLKKTLSDIGVAQSEEKLITEHSPMVRNRVTLMRLKRCIHT